MDKYNNIIHDDDGEAMVETLLMIRKRENKMDIQKRKENKAEDEDTRRTPPSRKSLAVSLSNK